MARASRSRYDSSGRRTSPPLVRLLRVLIPAVTVPLLAAAVWVGTRDRSVDIVEAGSVVVAPSTTATPPPASVTTQPSISSTTVAASTVPAPTTTLPAPPTGVAVARMRDVTPLAETPGGTGPALPAGSSVALLGEILLAADRTWYRVNSLGESGWVPASSIELVGNDFDARPCGEVPAALPSAALAYQPGTADGGADGIAAIEFHQSAECNRAVLFLADGLGTDEASFADAFPDGLSVVDIAGRVRVELNERILVIPELQFARFTVDGGDAIALLALRPDGRSAFNLDMGAARLSVSFLARPARVVLDTVRASQARPEIGGGVVVNAKSIHDALGAGDGRVVEIAGYARLGSGLGEVAFRQAPPEGAEDGSGRAIEVQFGGTSRVDPVFRSWYFFETPRFDGQWAEFRFTIAGLDPGRYELAFGLGATDIPGDIVDPGVFVLLVVDPPG